MRKAAGILMAISGMATMGVFVYGIQAYYGLPFNLLMIFSTVFVITGGIFCLRKTHWRVCLASAWLAVFIMIMWLTGFHPYAFRWLSWVFCILGTLPIIFVYLTRKEWKEIQG